MLPAESAASPAIGCSAFRRGVHDVLSKRRRAMVGAALFPSGWRPPGEGGEAKHFAPPLIGVAAPPVRRCILHLLDDGVRRSAPPALALARLAAARPGWGGSTVCTPVSWCLMAVPPVPPETGWVAAPPCRAAVSLGGRWRLSALAVFLHHGDCHEKKCNWLHHYHPYVGPENFVSNPGIQ